MTKSTARENNPNEYGVIIIIYTKLFIIIRIGSVILFLNYIDLTRRIPFLIHHRLATTCLKLVDRTGRLYTILNPHSALCT